MRVRGGTSPIMSPSKDELDKIIIELDTFLAAHDAASRRYMAEQDAMNRDATVLAWSAIATAIFGRRVLRGSRSTSDLCMFVPHAAVMARFAELLLAA